MIKTPKQQERDDFLSWLKDYLPELPSAKPVPAPSREWLDKAWQASHENYKHLHDHSVYQETIYLMAADDGNSRFGAVRISSKSGKWDLIREVIPDDPDWQILKLKCTEEATTELQGLLVTVEINGKKYVLGEINRRGIAETEVPSGLDLTQPTVSFLSPEE